MFYEMRHKNAMKDFRVLGCVIYDIIENDVCIDYLACQSNKLSAICLDKNIRESVLKNSWVLAFQIFKWNYCRVMIS